MVLGLESGLDNSSGPDLFADPSEQKIVRDVAVRIRKLRNERGWSQERLAEEAGIHRPYLAGIEAARRNPSLKNLIRIALALGVRMPELFGDR